MCAIGEVIRARGKKVRDICLLCGMGAVGPARHSKCTTKASVYGGREGARGMDEGIEEGTDKDVEREKEENRK